MKLKCLLEKVDFVPMLKSPRFWMAPETLKKGSILEVSPDIGYKLMADYPNAFEVLEEKVRKKTVKSEDLQNTETEALA
jgi:hypothetical protein